MQVWCTCQREYCGSPHPGWPKEFWQRKCFSVKILTLPWSFIVRIPSQMISISTICNVTVMQERIAVVRIPHMVRQTAVRILWVTLWTTQDYLWQVVWCSYQPSQRSPYLPQSGHADTVRTILSLAYTLVMWQGRWLSRAGQWVMAMCATHIQKTIFDSYPLR